MHRVHRSSLINTAATTTAYAFMIQVLQMRKVACKQGFIEPTHLGIGKELLHEAGMQVHVSQLV